MLEIISIATMPNSNQSKTRSLLVDVARQLFAKNGVEDTTMNDIAIASKKGRRTLYTYFKSKEDIYLAVIQAELDLLSEEMQKVAEKNITPAEKIIELIYARLETVKKVVYRNGTLKADFFRDIWEVEQCRKNFDNKSIILYRNVLNEGVRKGMFSIENTHLFADIMHYCIKGIEVPYIKGQVGRGVSEEDSMPTVRKLVYGALGSKVNI